MKFNTYIVVNFNNIGWLIFTYFCGILDLTGKITKISLESSSPILTNMLEEKLEEEYKAGWECKF